MAATVPYETRGPATLSPAPFEVRLEVFQGPFDLLLNLIGKHQLDVTEVALSQVTDEFIAHLRAAGPAWDLGQATEFLVVAATLLDLKTARLLPGTDVEDEEDLAVLEARDLLFARLLQYRAYKAAAAHLEQLVGEQAERYPRAVPLDPALAALLPEIVLGVDPERFAAVAAKALTPRPEPQIGLAHLHGAHVSVPEQTAVLRELLGRAGTASFRALTSDCKSTLEVVARFLGLLELFRDGRVFFAQAEAMGELHVHWVPMPENADD